MKIWRAVVTLLVVAALEVGAQAGSVPTAPPPRVALMDFVSEDNSYRSSAALGNLVSVLQAEVSGQTDYDWVERAELEKAANELKMAGLGLIDRSEAIRGGRWVKADWGIFGDISTNFNGNRTLSLEIVNLQRADVLAETNLSLPTPESGPFQMKSEYVANIAPALRTLLSHARKIYSDSEKQDAVAFPFLSLSQSGFGDAVGNLQDDFRRSLFTASTNSQRFHLIQFQRAGAAMDEANLVLSGLAESDSNSWEKVADHYVWGDARIDARKIFHQQTREWQDERKLEVKLNVWDGRGEPQVIALTVTNETSGAVARKLARAVQPLLRRDGAKPVLDNVRNRISDSIFARYTGLPINFSFNSPEGRRDWFDAVQLLETACFFNPGNAAAREQLLRLRWGTALPGYNAGSPTAREELERRMLTQALVSASRNEFFFARRRSEAWGKYVEQFGFKTALAQSNSPSVAAEYVLSAWRPFEMFEYAQENQAKWGVPRDAGFREVTGWQNQFGSEFVSRLLAAPDDPAFAPESMEFFCRSLVLSNPEIRTRMIEKYWPRLLERAGKSPLAFDDAYRHALKLHFEEIGRPGGDQKLLAQLEARNRGDKSDANNNPAPPAQVRLPRAAGLESESVQTGDVFPVGPVIFSPPLIEPDIQTISFPSGVQVKGVKSMVFHDDTLWLAVEVAEPLEIKALNGSITKEFEPVLVDRVRLWKLDASVQKLEPVAGPLATNDINSMMFYDNTLWLALNDNGIAALNPKTGELRRYGAPAGIISTNQFALAGTSRGIAAIGGWSDLLFMGNGMETWTGFNPWPHQNFSYAGNLRQIAGLKGKLLLYNSQVLLCDLESNTWTRIADPPSLDRIGRINSMADDGSKNFWIASDSGLHSVDSNTGRIRSQWIPLLPTVQTIKIPEFLPRGLAHKTDLQLVGRIQQKLQLRRRLLEARKTDTNQPNLFVPDSRLSAGILSVTADADFLWVFTKETTRPLLYHPASQKWVGGFSIDRMGTPSVLACGGGKLWLAARRWEDFAILKIDTSSLKSIPRERWLPDLVSREELTARVSNLPEHERAVYCFFSGNDTAAVELLQNQAEDRLDAESLFLLGSSFAEMGESNRAVHFEQKLAQKFPDSVFTKILSLGRRDKEARGKIRARLEANPRPESNAGNAFFSWVLRNADADGDGALEENEVAIFLELEPDQILRLVSNPNLDPTAAAAEYIQRCDRNRDGRLQPDELTTGPGNRPFVPDRRTRTTNQ
jgi:hypothetical protein